MAMPEMVARTSPLVLVNAVDPGLIHSDTLRDFQGLAGLMTRYVVACVDRASVPTDKAV